MIVGGGTNFLDGVQEMLTIRLNEPHLLWQAVFPADLFVEADRDTLYSAEKGDKKRTIRGPLECSLNPSFPELLR